MAKYRRERINDAVAKELAISLRELRDPRIAGGFVSITRAEVAPDLKFARVYFSTMGDEKEVGAALKKATGYFRRHLATTLNLRVTPELSFYSDHSIEHGARIAELLRKIETERPEEESTEEASEGGDGE